MTLREAISELESYLDGEGQSDRIDLDTMIAFDIVIDTARVQADLLDRTKHLLPKDEA